MTARAATRNPSPHRAAYPDTASECAAPFACPAASSAACPRDLTLHA